MGMADRAFLLLHPKYHAENIKFIDVLLNDYLLHFIFKTINKRLKFLIDNKTLKQNLNHSNEGEVTK